MKTRFEDLCNEILIDIFEYVASPNDVYRAFHKLNHHFDCLLRYVRLNLDIFLEDHRTRTIIHCFSTHCNRLHVHNVCPSLCLQHFSQLRALIISEPTDAQLQAIRSTTLPMLEYLASPASMTIFDCLFGCDEQQWLFLRSCNFYFPHFPNSKYTWQPNRTLRTLSGVTCSRRTLSQLLALLPCLQHLRVDMIANEYSEWNRTIFVKTLLSLRIGFYQLNYDDLCALVGPQLYRLHLEIFSEQFYLDFTLLGNLIMSLTTKLKQFQCDYRGMKVSLESIKDAHRFFHDIQLIKTHCSDTNSFICQNMV